MKRKSGSGVTNSTDQDQTPKTAKITKSDKSHSTNSQPKMCKIQFQDEEEISSEEQEEFAEIIPSCSRSIPMTSAALSSPQKSVKIRFRLASDDSGSEKDLEMEDEDLEQQLNDIFGSSSDSNQSIESHHHHNSS